MELGEGVTPSRYAPAKIIIAVMMSIMQQESNPTLRARWGIARSRWLCKPWSMLDDWPPPLASMPLRFEAGAVRALPPLRCLGPSEANRQPLSRPVFGRADPGLGTAGGATPDGIGPADGGGTGEEAGV